MKTMDEAHRADMKLDGVLHEVHREQGLHIATLRDRGVAPATLDKLREAREAIWQERLRIMGRWD